jgi:hypothetical protein
MKEALSSSETAALTRATLHNIPEDAILHTAYVLQYRTGCAIWISPVLIVKMKV